jgi:hypothetical protein
VQVVKQEPVANAAKDYHQRSNVGTTLMLHTNIAISTIFHFFVMDTLPL